MPCCAPAMHRLLAYTRHVHCTRNHIIMHFNNAFFFAFSHEEFFVGIFIRFACSSANYFFISFFFIAREYCLRPFHSTLFRFHFPCALVRYSEDVVAVLIPPCVFPCIKSYKRHKPVKEKCKDGEKNSDAVSGIVQKWENVVLVEWQNNTIVVDWARRRVGVSEIKRRVDGRGRGVWRRKSVATETARSDENGG